MLPLALPGVIAGSIFTFSLTLGDYVTPLLAGGRPGTQFIGNVVYSSVGISNNVPFAAAFATHPARRHGRVPPDRAPARRVRGDVVEQRSTRWALGAWTTLVILFLWLPLGLIMVYAFNKSNIQSWPIPGFTTHWFRVAWHATEVRTAIWLSVRAALLATGTALVLGSAAAFAIARFRFFGRETVSFLLVLPIALPGIITGMALNSFFVFNHINLSL